MDAEDRTVIREMYTRIRNSMATDGDLVAALMESGILSHDDKRHILFGPNNVQRDPQQKTEALLDQLPHLGKSALTELCVALSKSTALRNRQLAEELLERTNGYSFSSQSSNSQPVIATPSSPTVHSPVDMDALTIALTTTPWTTQHADTLLSVLSTLQKQDLLAQLLDDSRRRKPITRSPATDVRPPNPRLTRAEMERNYAVAQTETRQPNIAQVESDLTVTVDREPRNPTVNIEVRSSPTLSLTQGRTLRGVSIASPEQEAETTASFSSMAMQQFEYNPWNTDEYRQEHSRLVEHLPADSVRQYALSLDMITKKQEQHLSTLRLDQSAHNAALLCFISPRGVESFANFLTILSQLGGWFETVQEHLQCVLSEPNS